MSESTDSIDSVISIEVPSIEEGPELHSLTANFHSHRRPIFCVVESFEFNFPFAISSSNTVTYYGRVMYEN